MNKKWMVMIVVVCTLVFSLFALEEKSDFKIGNVYEGFRLIEKEYIEEAKVLGLVFLHEKSGARLLKLINDDKNNVFSISFRTLPQDNTGVAHIMEHSVLCGSERFPVKSPFDIMRKGSLRTFLNAMTSSDMTMYPIASKNKKDFYNLMNVYLDGVFHPALLEDERILRQEGWRYEWDPENRKLSYNGIVYNEMKGAMSSPESALHYAISQELLPDTIYANNSGGDPLDIPSLTQEMFVDFHTTFYHPSNAYIYLYGDLDTQEQLRFISKEYLNDYNKRENDFYYPVQKRFDERRSVVRPYPGGNKEGENQDYLSYHYLMNDVDDNVEMLALTVIEEYLMGTPASPLKKKLEEKGFGTLFYSFFYPSAYPIMSFVAVGGDREREKQFTALIDHMTAEIADKGMDETLLASIINRMEFRLREPSARFSRGLGYMFQTTRAWITHEKPFEGLRFEKALKTLRKDKTIWQRVLRKHFIDNDHVLSLTMIPDPEMNEKLHAMEQKRLEQILASLSQEEIEMINRDNEALRIYQETPDSEEDLSKVPLLSLSDIEPEIAVPEGDSTSINNIPVMTYAGDTHGIYYWELYFNIADFDREDLQAAVLLSRLLGKIGAGDRDYQGLSMALDHHTGGLSFNVSQTLNEQDMSQWNVHFTVSYKALEREGNAAMKLLGEVLSRSDFQSADRFRVLLENEKTQMERRLRSSGLDFAMARARSALGGIHVYSELTRGYSYYLFIKEIEDAFRSNPESVLENLKRVYEKIFVLNRLTIGFVTEEGLMKKGLSQTKKITDSLPPLYQGSRAPARAPQGTDFISGEGFAAPSRVNFVVQTADFSKEGQKYNGALLATATIVRNTYLWQSLRVRGGAYGGGMSVNNNGTVHFYSYRDPHLGRTLEIFAGISDYLSSFQPSEREMELYLIGTIANLDLPDTPLARGLYFFRKVLSQGDMNEINRLRKEVLSTTPEDLRKFAPLFRKMTDQGIYSIYGNAQQMKEAQGTVIEKIIPVE